MARKRRHLDPENHERWLVSYADFITLLFAFFVVMYSISSVNDGKYRVLSNTLTDAFLTPAQSADPIQIGEQARTLAPVAGEYAAPKEGDATADIVDDGEKRAEGVAEDGDNIAEGTADDGDNIAEGAADNGENRAEAAAEDVAGEQVAQEEQQQLPELGSAPIFQSAEETIFNLKSALDPFIDQNLVNIIKTDRGIEVEMRSKMLFESGSARLSRDAVAALRNVTAIIGRLPNQIQVEGHTDDVPIQTIAFPSNWELSAARAASVVHLFTRLGIDATRMSAIAYGEYQPVGDNSSEEGRQKNRRVAIVILHTPETGRRGGGR